VFRTFCFKPLGGGPEAGNRETGHRARGRPLERLAPQSIDLDVPDWTAAGHVVRAVRKLG